MSGLLTNLTAGILGDPKKAMIIVRARAAREGQPVSSKLAKTQKMLERATGLDIPELESGQRAMVVQYNPASLSIQATAQKIPFKRMINSANAGVVAQDMREPSTTLSVTLYFDDMNPKDAFMEEKFRNPLSSFGVGIEAGAALVKTLMGKHYSVQQTTNALVSLPLRDLSKQITFVWANLSFTGVVQQAQARYTMFSVSGRPIRSEINLSIVQSIPDTNESQYWVEAFDKCFKSKLAGSGGARSIGESASNILNISGF